MYFERDLFFILSIYNLCLYGVKVVWGKQLICKTNYMQHIQTDSSYQIGKTFSMQQLGTEEHAELKSKYSYLINWFWPHKYYTLGALMELPEGKLHGSPHSFISLADRCTLWNVTEYAGNKWGITLASWFCFPEGTLLLNESHTSKNIILYYVHFSLF